MESQMVDGPWKYKPKVLYIMDKHISLSKKIWKKKKSLLQKSCSVKLCWKHWDKAKIIQS